MATGRAQPGLEGSRSRRAAGMLPLPHSLEVLVRPDLSALVLGTALLLGTACRDDRQGPSAPGGSCAKVSDCQAGLRCEFQLCQEPCTADSQCPGPQRCVRAVAVDDAGTAGGVCQLPEHTACTRATDCLGAQVCRVAECRDECTRSSECSSGQVCANGGSCASTDPTKDRVSSDGNILPDASGGPLLDANMTRLDSSADAR